LLVTVCLISRFLILKPEKKEFSYDLETKEPFVNPLMGLAPWATIEKSQQPHTLVYAELTWRDFEPQEGFYDFQSFESKNQFDRWKKEGKRLVFRFILDKPGKQTHLDIPDWLYDKINWDGKFYDSEYGFGFSPNYENALLIEEHAEAIEALGNRYGGQDFISFIEMGSLGHWGEWHVDVKAGIDLLPDEAIRNAFVLQYIEAFPNTHLLMRRPFTIASDFDLGLYNDMTGDFASTMTWLEWIHHGGEYSQTGEINGLSPMPEGWRLAPIGGEQAINLRNEDLYLHNLDQTLSLLRQSHTTFIGPNGPYAVPEGSWLQSGVDQVMGLIGYRLFIEKMIIRTSKGSSRDINIELIFGNNGLAPIYYNWPTHIYLFDKNKNTVYDQQLQIDLREIVPNQSVRVECTMPISSELEPGVYSLGIAITDTITQKPAVRFAMKNEENELIYKLGEFKINGIIKKSIFSRNIELDY